MGRVEEANPTLPLMFNLRISVSKQPGLHGCFRFMLFRAWDLDVVRSFNLGHKSRQKSNPIFIPTRPRRRRLRRGLRRRIRCVPSSLSLAPVDTGT